MDGRIIRSKDDLSEEEKVDLLSGTPEALYDIPPASETVIACMSLEGNEAWHRFQRDPELRAAHARDEKLDDVFRDWDTTMDAEELPSMDILDRPIEKTEVWGVFSHDFPDTSNPSTEELPEWRRKGAKVYIHCVLDPNIDDSSCVSWYFRDAKFTAIDPFKGVDTSMHEYARYDVTRKVIEIDRKRCGEYYYMALSALVRQRLRNLSGTSRKMIRIPEWASSYSLEEFAKRGDERSWRIDHAEDDIEMFYKHTLPHVPYPRTIADRSDLFVMEKWEIVLDLLQQWKSQELPEPALVSIDTITVEDRDEAIDMIFEDDFEAVHVHWQYSAEYVRKPDPSILRSSPQDWMFHCGHFRRDLAECSTSTSGLSSIGISSGSVCKWRLKGQPAFIQVDYNPVMRKFHHRIVDCIGNRVESEQDVEILDKLLTMLTAKARASEQFIKLQLARNDKYNRQLLVYKGRRRAWMIAGREEEDGTWMTDFNGVLSEEYLPFVRAPFLEAPLV